MATDKLPLGESPKRLEMALGAARGVAWEFDVATGNLEYSSEEGLTRVDDRSLSAELLEHALRGSGPFGAEFRLVGPDGGVVWTRYQGEVVRDENSQRVIGIAFDITRNKQADELFGSILAGVSGATGEAFLRLLVQHLSLVLKVDLACISELNEHTLGTVRTFAMFSDGKFADEFDYELAGTPCEQVLALGRGSYPQGVQASFPNDHLLVEMGIEGYLGVPLLGSSGQALGVMTVLSRSAIKDFRNAERILNIFAPRVSAEVERRRAERALRESESWNRAILDALPDLTLVWDGAGIIHDINAKDSIVLNVPRESISAGKHLVDVLGEEIARLIMDSSMKAGSGTPALTEYSKSVSGQVQFYEARTVSFGQDRLLTIIRSTTEKKQAEAKLQESQQFAQRIAETTPSVLFVYDLIARRNVYANERSVDVIGYTPKEIEAMGENFLSELMHPDDLAMLPQLAQEYSTRRDGEVFEHMFRMRHKNGQWRWVQRSATIFGRTPEGRPRSILGAVTDITSFKEAERELQRLSSRLLSIQDEERRRIARELHDVTGQNLTAIGLNLTVLDQSADLDPNMKAILSECQKLCEESNREIRTLSYLLHPPMLDEFGLIGTLEWYITGFRKRTRINAVLDVSKDFGRLPTVLETDLFRVIQEGLTNIMRYSGSETAFIRLTRSSAEIVLQIEDRGRGLKSKDSEAQGQDAGFGVGIPGIRERLRQHGGSLQIASSIQGTILTAIVPLASGNLPSKSFGKSAG